MSKFLDEFGLARVWENIKIYLQENYGNSGGGGSVALPPGIVCAWAGSADDVPDGWHLCDGDSGTPDLRDRFILGAGTHTVGETGGEEEVTLTIMQIPIHSHIAPTSGSANIGQSRILNTGFTSGGNVGSIDYSTRTNGGDRAHNNMPPYYTLCYIMKL